MDKQEHLVPRYQKIALDIASKIISGQHKEGDKIFARSYVASQYKVSPETARRAICVLSDLNIVETSKGSGVRIKSAKNAATFVKQHQNIYSIDQIKEKMQLSMKRQMVEIETYWQYAKELVDRVEKFRAINPLTPYQLTIEHNNPHITKTIDDIKLWHHTNATLIAIKRGDTMLLSPGPYAELMEGDIFYFIGTDESVDKVKSYFGVAH